MMQVPKPPMRDNVQEQESFVAWVLSNEEEEEKGGEGQPLASMAEGGLEIHSFVGPPVSETLRRYSSH